VVRRWCARADAIFDIPDMHVLDVKIDNQQRLVLTIEFGQLKAGCPGLWSWRSATGRRVRILHDALCFGRVTILRCWCGCGAAKNRCARRQRSPSHTI
jgi:hypothetical protein